MLSNPWSVSQTVYKLEPCKEKHKFAKLRWDCKTGMGKVFTKTNAISKRKKIELPDWRLMKVLSKGLQMV